MTILEFQNIAKWIVRVVVYGGAGALFIGILIVFFRSLRSNYRSWGALGILLVLLQLGITLGVLLIGFHYANAFGVVEKVQSLMP